MHAGHYRILRPPDSVHTKNSIDSCWAIRYLCICRNEIEDDIGTPYSLRQLLVELITYLLYVHRTYVVYEVHR